MFECFHSRGATVQWRASEGICGRRHIFIVFALRALDGCVRESDTSSFVGSGGRLPWRWGDRPAHPAAALRRRFLGDLRDAPASTPHRLGRGHCDCRHGLCNTEADVEFLLEETGLEVEDVTVRWRWLRGAEPSLLGPPMNLEPKNDTGRAARFHTDGGARGHGPSV